MLNNIGRHFKQPFFMQNFVLALNATAHQESFVFIKIK